MKYLIFLFVLATSCSSLRKSVDKQKQDVNVSTLITKDSTGHAKVDSGAKTVVTGSSLIFIDSGYDKVIEETVNETIDSISIRRETKRVIKEKGQKRVEQSTQISKYDSTSKKTDQTAEVKQVQKEDSTGVTIDVQKDVKRTTLFPWWLWLIVVGAGVGLVIWKRNPIIKFLT